MVTDRGKELGMSLSKAQHKLRRILFFEMLKKTGQDICYDCKKKILTPGEVSIQHKKVWLHVDPRLFWDLDNIAFSHMACNRAVRNPLWGQRAPHGTKTRYSYHGCRCQICTIGIKLYMRNQRAKNKTLRAQ